MEALILITLCYNVGWINDEEHRVIDDFERNKILIDSTQQPDEIKAGIRDVFAELAKIKYKMLEYIL